MRLRAELKAVAVLAVPIALASVGQATMGLVDTAVVGRYGAVAQGAVGLGNAIFFAVMSLGMGAMMGFDPLFAQALGAGEAVRARGLTVQAAWLSLALGAALTPAVLLLVWGVSGAGLDPALWEQASAYLLYRLPSLPAVFAFIGARAYLQAVGRTRSLVWATLWANAANFGLDLLLVFGGASLPAWTGPLRAVPELGAGGSAIATALCSYLMAAIVLRAVRRLTGPVSSRGPDLTELRRALWTGLPIGLQLFAEVGVFSLVGFLAARLGAAPLAAHQVAITYASVSFCAVLGIGSAGSVRVGRAVGAGDLPGARRAGGAALLAGVAVMSTSALTFFLFPRALAGVMTSDRGVLEVVVPLLAVTAWFQLSDGVQGVGAGILRGAGDTRVPFLANLVGHYGIGLPLGVALGLYGGHGVEGLWWGLSAGLTAVALGLVTRFVWLTARPIARL